MLETIAGKQALVTGAASGIGQAVARRLAARRCRGRRGRSSTSPASRGSRPKASARSSPTSASAEGRERVIRGGRRLRLPRQRGRDHPARADPRDDAGRLARHLRGQRRGGLLPLPADRPAAARPAARSSTSPRPRPRSPSTTEAAIYAASKAAVISITRSFAYALASRPVRVNAVCPGITDTPMQEQRPRRRSSAIRGTTYEELARRRVSTAVPLARTSLAGRVRRRDPLPALRRGRLHDRAGDQLLRRAGDDVTSGRIESDEEADRGRRRGARASGRARTSCRTAGSCSRTRTRARSGVWEPGKGNEHLRAHGRRPERVHARHRRLRLRHAVPDGRRLGRAGDAAAVDPAGGAGRNGRGRRDRGRRHAS